MISFTSPALSDWHAGEKQLQRALRYSDDVQDAFVNISSELPSQHRAFHSHNLAFLPLATRSASDNRVWCSILCPDPTNAVGWITSPTPSSLIVLADVWEGDPVRESLHDGGLLAAVGVSLTTRRRNKFAGKVAMSAWDEKRRKVGMEIAINEAIGNCPKYITVQQLAPYQSSPTVTHSSLHLAPSDAGLPASLIDFVHSSSALYLATATTTHLGCNHRGGPPGFTRILPSSHGRTLVLPDFSGNRFMSSLGNIQLDPHVGLVFPSFDSGDVLYLTGTATNVVGHEASEIMERSKLVTVVQISGFVFVKNALSVRSASGTRVEPSPYSPRVRFLVEERRAAGFVGPASGAGAQVRLVKAQSVGEGIARFDFEGEGMSWTAGQYVVLDCLELLGGEVGYQHMARTGNERSVNEDGVRTWTISTAPSPTHFSLTLRLVPNGTITPHLFHHLHYPTSLSLPLLGTGGSFVLPDTPRRLLWIAGGIGLTPFLAFLGALAGHDGWEVEFLVGTKEPETMRALVEHALGANSTPTVRLRLFSKGSVEGDRVGKQVIEETVARLKPQGFYVCGPAAFEMAVMEGLESAGVKGDEVVREKFNY